MRAIWKVTVDCSLVQTDTKGESTSNHDSGKVLRLLIDFLCLGNITAAKIKPICEVRFVWVLTTKHYSAAVIHLKIAFYMDGRL